MSYWSNIQASRITRGSSWKNLWIPNYKKIYTKYFINDYVMLRYLKVKFFGDDKLNWTFMYYFDYFLNKTYDQTFLYLKKYNIDFARLSQAVYVGRLLNLHEMMNKTSNMTFYIATMGPKNLINYHFWPHCYYYFYLLGYYKNHYDVFSLNTKEPLNLNEEQISLLYGITTSLFVAKNIFSTKTNFFGVNDFHEISFFHHNFIERNITRYKSDELSPDRISGDRFRLANFLFNPTILKKYPNFIFFYNSWLHKSWQLSKRWTIESLKLFQVSYNHAKPSINTINFFYSKYIRLFYLMRELNIFFKDSLDAGVGLTQEFIAKQIWILHTKLRIWDNMVLKIKEIWFYLKAYLRYFSYEGKINLNWSKIIFKKLFFLKKLIWIICSGQQLSTPTLISFLKVFYFTPLDKKFIFYLFRSFCLKRKFLKKWYLTFTKFYLKTLLIAWKIFWFWKLEITKKIILISYLSNKFVNNLSFFKKINFPVYPKLLELDSLNKFISLSLNINSIFVLFLFFCKFNLKLWKNKKQLLCTTTQFFLTDSTFSISSQSWNFLKKSYYNLLNIRQVIKQSDWFALIGFNPQLITIYLQFSLSRKLIWKRKFIYFYYILSKLNPKLFFRILIDLGNLTHFALLMHFVILYWQNFFFFYLFILKCLKKMYTYCSEESLLALSRPLRMFMQRSKIFITTLDLFSSSFRDFLTLGISCFNQNFDEGNQKWWVTLVDFASWTINFGKPNCWINTTGNKFTLINKFAYTETNSQSSFYMPLFSTRVSSKVFFKRNSNFIFEKKNWIDVSQPYFANRVPTHLIEDYYSNLHLSATLIAVFVKKKLERDHLLAEVLWSLNILLSQADMIKGFMFLLKGRFSRRERATKVWLKKGRLDQVNIWTKLDYCKTLITLKYGAVSVRIWLLLGNSLNDFRAMI